MESIDQVVQRQQEVLEAMGRITCMRRGTLSKQEYTNRRKRKDGAGATGPYFVWQGSIRGKHFSHRVCAQQAQRLAQEIDQRREFERLSAEYIALGEAMARLLESSVETQEEVKKKPRQPSSRGRK